MNSRTKNILSLISNILIVAFTTYVVSLFFTNGGMANMPVMGFRCLIFFTTDSNILVAIASLVMLPYNIRNLKSGENKFPKFIYLFKFTGAVAVSLTCITCVVFLGPVFQISGVAPYFFLFSGTVCFLHLITPVISAVSVVMFESSSDELENKKHAAWGVLPTFVYSMVYLYEVVILGPAKGGWNDFYGFTFGGKPAAAVIALIVMYAVSYFIARLELAWHRRF